MRADNSEYFADTALNEESECHSRLPRLNDAPAIITRQYIAVLIEI